MEGRGEVPEECVYGCVHPWWGGNGACSDTEIYGASIRGDSEVCQCDPGYATRDALGNPSCVPRKVHFIAFLMLALVGLGLMAFLLSVAKADMKLSHGDRSIRRARLRKRVTLPASVFVAGVILIASLAAGQRGDAPLFAGASYYIFYVVALPAGNLACTLGAEIWVEALPIQILPSDSFATRLRNLAEKRSVFLWTGSSLMSSMAMLGSLGAIFGTRYMARVIHLMSIFTASGACVCILFVGISLTRVINSAKTTAPPSRKCMYDRALKNLWSEVIALCVMGSTWVIATSALELTRFWHATPSIVLLVMLTDGSIMLSSIVYFSNQAPRPTGCANNVAPRSANTSRRDAQARSPFTMVATAVGAARNIGKKTTVSTSETSSV